MADPRIDFDESILRDDLALDRTVMANERTLLSYMRTALFLLVTGLSPLKLFPENAWMLGIGSFVVLVSVGVTWFGIYRFRHVQRKIYLIRKSVEGEKPVI